MLIAVDTETGGLDPIQNDILSIAFYNPDTEIYIQIKGDPKFCDAKALEINGLDPTQGVTRAEAQEQLIAWWTKLGQPKFQLVGHNAAAFDLGFIKQLALPSKFYDYHIEDSMIAMAILKRAGKINLPRVNLKACCDYFGITFEAHNALEDAKASWQVYQKCLDLLRN